NISHSQNWVCIGFSEKKAIGVDLEFIKPRDLDRLAQRVFTKKEKEIFKNLNSKQKTKYFYESWVKKEAYLKMTGRGLGGSMKTVDVRDIVIKTKKYITFSMLKLPAKIQKKAVACVCLGSDVNTASQ
ncbi:MAG: 4'-phosphopantetheinyl transferase superfamily protein, partial [Bacteriovoracia bacterium]